MSSKVFPNGQDPGVAPLAWRKITPMGAEERPQAGEQNNTEVVDALRLRLQQVEAQMGAREEQARQQAHQAGYQAGLREGDAAATRRLSDENTKILGRTMESVQQMLSWRQQIRKQMEEDLVHLAVAIARRILHRELAVDPTALLGIVQVAISKVESRELHRLRAASQDVPVLQQHINSLGIPARVELVGDPSLSRGSIVLETARGQLDASVDIQLQEIDRGLADVVRRAV
jgi:flagellar assembly protein FliH